MSNSWAVGLFVRRGGKHFCQVIPSLKMGREDVSGGVQRFGTSKQQWTGSCHLRNVDKCTLFLFQTSYIICWELPNSKYSPIPILLQVFDTEDITYWVPRILDARQFKRAFMGVHLMGLLNGKWTVLKYDTCHPKYTWLCVGKY